MKGLNPAGKQNLSRKPRPVLYIYRDPQERHCWWFHGLTFHEFYAALRLKSPLVLLAPDSLDELNLDEDITTRFAIVRTNQLQKLAQLDLHSECGDFLWVDAPGLRALPHLPATDFASLLYLARTFKPLRGPFIRSLRNRFAYLGHDDGWLLKLYAREPTDISRLIEKVASAKALRYLKIKFSLHNKGPKFMRHAKEGLLLDFRPERNKPPAVRLHRLGTSTDIDAIQQHVASPVDLPKPFQLLMP